LALTDPTPPSHAALPDAPSPLTLLRRLGGDEDASAAVEFIVLIPVYLLLIAGLYTFVNLAQIRQQLVQANRFQVWSANDPAALSGFDPQYGGKAFFGPYEGVFKPTRSNDDDDANKKTLASGMVSVADLRFQGGEGAVAKVAATREARSLAMDALNNSRREGNNDVDDPPHLWVEAQASYRYTGLKVLGMPEITQSTRGAVLLARNATRREFSDGDKEHPVLAWRVDNDDSGPGSETGKARYFDPSQDANMPINPTFDTRLPLNDGNGDEFADDQGRPNSGVWSIIARIRGDWFDPDPEYTYYRPKPKR
jgi:hypothetical protein